MLRDGEQKERTNYIPKYFMAVKNYLIIWVCLPVRISANYVQAGNLNATTNPSSYLFYFLYGFCLRFNIFLFNSNSQPLG